MPRNRIFITAPIVLLIVLVGVFFIRSRGDDSPKVETKPTRNCPPIARPDAVATKPGTPIAIDVLANDTDPDGDPLVFQIRKTVGGESSVDDGGTPTDAADDRVLFTPADPAPAQATIDYEAVDPTGALSESTVTVEINPDAVLPAGVHSEDVPTDNETTSDGCGTGRVTTTTATSTTLTTVSTGTTLSGQSNTATTTRKNTSTRDRTTTTRRPATTTTTQNPATTTTARPATTTTSTTRPRNTTTTKDCGPQPDPQTQADEYNDWARCTYGG